MANKIIDSLTYGSDNYTFTIPYGTCSTAATISEKKVTCPNFTVLEEGARVAVKFTYRNKIESPTLNVNSTGAKTISSGAISNGNTWQDGAVVDFIFNGIEWQISHDAALYAGLMEGDISPRYSERAGDAEGLYVGKNDPDGDPITLTPEYLGVLATQNSCFALGAKVANTNSAYPPFLVSKTSSTTTVNVYAGTLLTRHPGLRFSTEWYSGDFAGANYATGEFVISNYSPFPIAVYFYLTASFGYNSDFQNASSSRVIKILEPGETVSGETNIANPWGSSGQLASNSPGVTVEAIGYDTSDMY